ncbi:MAG: S8 family serine peptidase [Planctomycetaceae bacterium]|nr:S8 family serine peptidase [Planctomycetaceae bacterium]
MSSVKSHAVVLASLALLQLTASVVPVPATEPRVRSFPTAGLLPKEETGAARFLEQHPEYDGRGVVVAIFDTGVDPGAAGLAQTSDGRPKFVDLIDATGDGDVVMSDAKPPEDGQLEGLTGRQLTIPSEWRNPSGNYRLGIKRAYDLFPPELIERLDDEESAPWDVRQRGREADLRRQIHDWDDTHPEPSSQDRLQRDELQARLDVLIAAQEDFENPGPVYDCVLFHDGEVWRAVIDTDEDGDLSDEQLLTDFHRERQFASFGDQTQLNFSVSIYDDGDLLSIVIPSGSHGTHVAGIVAAYEPDHPERNGIAPGAQLVSVKIGDNRIEGMEAGRALVRGLRAAVDRHCDLINMSYGEPTSTPNRGRLTELFSDVVREHGMIFVSSAGNEGPALSTVGAPGGTTEALLGIGAYVSPAMMSPQYGLLETLDGMPYTWSSRGPTTDGASGVDLIAPGGAFSPVPNYELRRSMQANGTSMSSPNACGNIALLLSGLKAAKIEFTPALIRRALENTASRLPGVEYLAQGAGLIQTDRAWEWLQQEDRRPAESLTYSIEVGPDARRGVLLREPLETQRPLAITVEVQPQFSEKAPKRPRVDLEIPVTLEATADWVQASESVLLTSAGESFRLRVDPRNLDHGLHTAEVRGYLAGHEGRGPLFRVPVTVIKPRTIAPQRGELLRARTPEQRLEALRTLRGDVASGRRTNEMEETLSLRPGQIERRFLIVPEGATWLDLHFDLEEAETARSFTVHTVQTLAGHSYEDGQVQDYLNMQQGSRTVRSVPVVGGCTLELCVAQYWSNLGTSRLKMLLEFRGLTPDDRDLTLPSDGSPLEVAVTSSVRRERCEPAATLTTRRRLFRPASVKKESLLSSRDRQLDGGPTHRLILTYEFTQPSDSPVSIRIPELEGLLYDAPVESHQWMLFDANRALVATDDMYPDSIELTEGDYTLRLELRHADAGVLETFEAVPLAVDWEHAFSLKLKAYASRADAAAWDTEFESRWLDPGQRASIFLTGPDADDLPDDAEPGDLLIGTVTFVNSPAGVSGARARPEGYPVRFVVPPLPEDSDDPAPTEKTPEKPLAARLQQQRIDLLVKQLGELDWSDDAALFNELAADILKQDADAQRRVLVAKLHLIDNDDREERLSEVIAAADEVIDTISTSQMARQLVRRPDPERPNTARQRKDAEALRDILVDALYRKARAVAFQELPEVVEKHPIEDQAALDREFEQTFRQLVLWADTTSEKHYLLQIRREQRRERYGTALKLLNQHIDGASPADRQQMEKRRDLYEKLGWEDWYEYEQRWLLIQFPDEWQPF